MSCTHLERHGIRPPKYFWRYLQQMHRPGVVITININTLAQAQAALMENLCSAYYFLEIFSDY
jgi:hypothetical protein